MTRVTFGVSASLFVANMAVRQNSVDLAIYEVCARLQSSDGQFLCGYRR